MLLGSGEGGEKRGVLLGSRAREEERALLLLLSSGDRRGREGHCGGLLLFWILCEEGRKERREKNLGAEFIIYGLEGLGKLAGAWTAL